MKLHTRDWYIYKSTRPTCIFLSFGKISILTIESLSKPYDLLKSEKRKPKIIIHLKTSVSNKKNEKP